MAIMNIGFSSGYDIYAGRNPYIAKAGDAAAPEINNNQTDSSNAAEIKVDDSKDKPGISITPIDDRPRFTAPESVSPKFNKGEDYSYIGSDSDIATLDMRKAISEARQDTLFNHYNYFVGGGNKIFSSEDGTVIAK